MNRISVAKNIVFSLLGLALLAAGLVTLALLPGADGILGTLPFVCVGIGAGVFGGSLGAAIRLSAARKNPKAFKQAEVAEKDERNIAIRNRAKAKAYDLMLLVYGALVMAFALMRAPVYVVLSLVAAYLFVVLSNVYYLVRYQKEM